MKTITYSISYGGFIGADEEYTIEVDDDATQDEIENEVQTDFEEKVLDNCGWEIISIEEDEE